MAPGRVKLIGRREIIHRRCARVLARFAQTSDDAIEQSNSTVVSLNGMFISHDDTSLLSAQRYQVSAAPAERRRGRRLLQTGVGQRLSAWRETMPPGF
jgi:hypothetical protein